MHALDHVTPIMYCTIELFHSMAIIHKNNIVPKGLAPGDNATVKTTKLGPLDNFPLYSITINCVKCTKSCFLHANIEQIESMESVFPLFFVAVFTQRMYIFVVLYTENA